MNKSTLTFFLGLVGTLLCIAPLTQLQAHHSFSAFDVDTKIERTGVITRYSFIQPHILMEIEVTDENGEVETWEIESLVPRRWNSEGYDRDFVKVGDTATIVGFPARNGSTEMMLSAIRSEQGELVVRDEIRQGRD